MDFEEENEEHHRPRQRQHRPPAYYRYKGKHPTVSFCLTTALRDLLDKKRGKLSYGQIVQKIIIEQLSISDEVNRQCNDFKNKHAENQKIICTACKQDTNTRHEVETSTLTNAHDMELRELRSQLRSRENMFRSGAPFTITLADGDVVQWSCKRVNK